jgi:hypothetical protein
MDNSDGGHENRGFFASRANIVLVGFLLIGGFYLVAEHRAHLWLVLPWLPWLLLLACPLMHVFMHHGHGGHGGNSDSGHTSSVDPQNSPRPH